MRKVFPILLIGCLSMFFAEVFSGASQSWFINGWGILITFPLYLCHVLFFLWIALKFKKTSLYQLYLLGVIFALYESWITKVLWAGYINSAGPGIGAIFGIAIPEFLILVFFWHPIMSFILPILVFEVLTKKAIIKHKPILKKTRKKTILIILFLFLVSTFIANGNNFDIISSNLSVVGTLLLISGLYYMSRKTDIKLFEFNKRSFTIVFIYLFILYVGTFFLLLPERIPHTIAPYISIIIFYIVIIYLILKSKTVGTKLININKDQYSSRDLITFAFVIILALNIANIWPSISHVLLIVTYYALVIIGTIIFIVTIWKNLKKAILQKYKK